MKRLRIILILMIVVTGLVGCEDEPATVITEIPTVGIVYTTVTEEEDVVAGFYAGMQTYGYTEGENITYEVRKVGFLEVGAAAQELVDLEVDLIFTVSDMHVMMAKDTFSQLPTIFAWGAYDPVAFGVVESFREPGGTITGIYTPDSNGKRLQYLIDLDPDVDKIVMPYAGDDPGVTQVAQDLIATAADLNIDVVVGESSSLEEERAFIASVPADADAIFLELGVYTLLLLPEWIARSVELNIPITLPLGELSSTEILFGYGYTLDGLGQQAARMVDQVLKGADPGNLPVEEAEFSLIISMPAAERLGIEIPDSMLRQAATIIRAEDADVSAGE